MSLFPLEYLRHIFDETKYLMDRAEGLSKEEFINGVGTGSGSGLDMRHSD